MMVMTAKLNLKKILVILAAAAAVVLSLILLLGGNDDSPAPAVSGSEARVKFLRDLGWEVADTPTESGQVRVPREASQIYERYNNLQKSQGYDLTAYAGKKVMRYVYPVTNYPGSTAPVYATVLVHKDQIIGGDITDTSVGGKIRGLRPGDAPRQESPAEQPQPAAQETLPQVTESGIPH